MKFFKKQPSKVKPLDPSPPIPQPVKDIVLTKLSHACKCSVLTHVVFILFYIVIINYNFKDPVYWLQSIYNSILSYKFWLYSLPFFVTICLQGLILSKEYFQCICKNIVQGKRFISKLLSKVTSLVMCVIGGVFAVWLYLCLSEDSYNALYSECEQNKLCLQEGSLFLILNGAWNGFYFFIQTNIHEKILKFPIIQLPKFQIFKFEFVNILKESSLAAIYPTIFFTSFYYICNTYIYDLYSYIFSLPLQYQNFGYDLYMFTWTFTSVYIIHMALFEFFINLFLTQPVQFPLLKSSENDVTLSEALLFDTIPVIQQLASLDLYLLSMWSPQRRQTLYTLSQPGGHPYTWNQLANTILTLMNDFADSLNESMDSTANEVLGLQSETSDNRSIERNLNLRPIPRLIINSVEIVEVQRRSTEIRHNVELLKERLVKILCDVFDYFRSICGLKLGNVSREVNIHDSLKYGQTMEWLTRGLANITVASVEEDPYGIIQSELSNIVTTLFHLKVASEKLNKSVSLMKKSSKNHSVKMNNTVLSATKRSLTQITRKFRNYLHDLHLKKDIIIHLKNLF